MLRLKLSSNNLNSIDNLKWVHQEEAFEWKGKNVLNHFTSDKMIGENNLEFIQYVNDN